MRFKNKLENLGIIYQDSLSNCLHASFIAASELLIPEIKNIIICIFHYHNDKSHTVVLLDNFYYDLWVGAIINRKYMIEHKFSFFNEDKFKKFYVANNPENINFINVGYINEHNGI